MADDENEDVDKELDALFSFNPPPLHQNPDFSPFPSVSPVSFYDKHLDDRLILKRIRLIPSLSQSLSGAVDETLKSLSDQGIPNPASVDGLMLREARKRYLRRVKPIVDARCVAEYYRDLTANSCLPVASTILLHPRADDWWSVFHWRFQTDGRPWQEERFSTQEYALRLNATPQHDFKPPTMLTLDEEIITSLQQVAKRFPQLATWDIYALSPDVERMLEYMETLVSFSSFSSEIPLTSGYEHTPSNREIFDATTAPWTIPPDTAFETAAVNVGSAPPMPAGPTIASSDAVSSDRNIDIVSTLRRSARLKEASMAKNAIGIIPDPNLTKSAKKRVAGPARGSDGRKSNPVIRPPSKTVKRARKYDKAHFPAAEQFLQHAWSQSVRDDSTIIIFHCGNFERIGIRHRKSQTLYLSGLINIPNCTNPSYFKLHVGLCIAAMRDSIDRAAQQSEIEATDGNPKHFDDYLAAGSGKKRLHDDLLAEMNKRHKKGNADGRMKANSDDQINEGDRSQYTEIILKAAGLRNLALIRLQYGVYDSPVPASFLRCGPSLSSAIGPLPPRKAKDSYRSYEYFTLVLTSEIGDGATGIVHGATLELETSDTQSLIHEVVVKLAFSDEQQERLRNEYTIYQHLATANVMGIPTVLGLFEDLEGGSIALVMNNAGVSLWEKRADERGQVTVSPSERADFIRILRDIHRAGVRHHDIRAENLLVSSTTGEVAIIDFDKAEIGPTKGAQEREDDKLSRLLNGNYSGPSLSPESNVE